MLKGVHLALLAGAAIPAPVPKDMLDALTSVEVTSTAGEMSGFQLSFTLNSKSTLHSALLIAATRLPLMRLLMVVTIDSFPHVLMDGVVTHQEVSAGEQPGQSTLRVTGEDLSKMMDLQAFDGLPFPATSDHMRVTAILSKYAVFGVVPCVIPSLNIDVPIPAKRIPAQEGTDLAYILTLAEKAGYVFHVEPGTVPGSSKAYWGPQIKVGIPQPALNLDMDAHRNVDSLSFKFNSVETDLPVVMIHNALTKIPLAIPIPKINPLQPPLGLVGPKVTKLSILKTTAKLSLPLALGEGIKQSAESLDAVTASGSLDVSRYGRLLKPRGLVGVRGAGLAFNGLYYVRSVTTTIKRGECKQSFELTRNGLVSITSKVPA